MWRNNSKGAVSQEMGRVLLWGGIPLQRVQLNTAIDQSTYNAENDRVLGQMMAKALGEHLKLVEWHYGVLHHNAILGKKTVVSFLLFGQGMITSCFEG